MMIKPCWRHAALLSVTLAGLTGALSACEASAPQLAVPPTAADQIDRVVKTLYENGQFAGAVLVSVNGTIVYRKAVGYADLERRVPNRPDTQFRIASFTKPLTALLILQLVEEGRISLDGRLTDYLPGFAVDGGDRITIHQLLTHTAGIAGESRIDNLLEVERQHYSRRELLDLIMARPLVFAPGSGREYSNLGYSLLAMVIEHVTGKSYDDVLDEKVSRPAGMTSTRTEDASRPSDRQAIGYVYDYFTGFEPASPVDMSFCLGAGHLVSTVDDLHRFDQALYGDALLSERSRELFFNRYGWLPADYRYGRRGRTVPSNNLEGSVNGFQSHTQRVAKDRVFIVALRNVKEAVYENQIVIKWPSALVSPVLSVLYGEEYDLPKMSGAFAVFRTLVDSGPDGAERVYAGIARAPDRHYFDEKEFVFFEGELTKRGLEEHAGRYREIRQRHSQR